MILILARLQALTLKGRLVRSYRLLRQPKYFVGALVGVLWIGAWVIRPILRSKVPLGSALSTVPVLALMPTVHRIAAIAGTIFLPLPWLLPWGRLGLPFREAELTMLLQAPLTRRQVIQYGLLKSEVGVVVSALLVSLLFSGRGLSSSWLASFLGTWLVFELLHLNGKWRALFVTGSPGRRLPVAVGLLAFYAVLFSALVPFLARVGYEWRGLEGPDVGAALAALEWPALVVWLSTPAWWLAAPMFATDGATFVVALIPVVLAVIVQREIVLRSKTRFEESALAYAKTQELKAASGPRGTRRFSWTREKRPFELKSEGRPEVAVLWKNSMRVSRLPWLGTLGVAAAALVAVTAAPAILRLPDVTYGILAVLGAVLLVVHPIMGGMTWNNDLRTELAHIESVRTWPVAAHRFLMAEVASSALMSFAGAMFGAGVALASFFGSRLRQALTGEPVELTLLPRSGELLGVDNAWAAVLIFVACVPVTAAASFFSSALQNLAVLLMPAWMTHTVDSSRGVAAFGQRMLSSFALGLIFALALVPSALLVGAALFAQFQLGIPWSAWAFPLWGVLAAFPPALMGWALLRLAAPLWERLDPSEELLEIGR